MRRLAVLSDARMLHQIDEPTPRLVGEEIATLDPGAISALEEFGVSLTRKTVWDAPGPTWFAYIKSDEDEFLLVFHPRAPIPAIAVIAREPDAAALRRLVDNLGGNHDPVTWQSDDVR